MRFQVQAISGLSGSVRVQISAKGVCFSLLLVSVSGQSSRRVPIFLILPGLRVVLFKLFGRVYNHPVLRFFRSRESLALAEAKAQPCSKGGAGQLPCLQVYGDHQGTVSVPPCRFSGCVYFGFSPWCLETRSRGRFPALVFRLWISALLNTKPEYDEHGLRPQTPESCKC